jgi:hypothetical protein
VPPPAPVVVLVVPPLLVLVAIILPVPVALLPPTPVPVALLPPTPLPVALLPPTPVFLLVAGERRVNPSNRTVSDTPSRGRIAPGDRLWKQAE